MKNKENFANIELIFSHVAILCNCNPETYDEKTTKSINDAIHVFSREIAIDKTYVEYKGTKYKKTFITEEGWNDMCTLLNETQYGRKVNREQNEVLLEMYKLMIVQYLYQCLDDLGYAIEDIHLEVSNDSRFMVQINENNIIDNYPGKWQYWDANV